MLVISTLIILSVGAAVVVTFLQGRGIADNATERAVERGAEAQNRFQLLYEKRLELFARIFNDQYLNAYLAEAAEFGDTNSILDLLDTRQAEAGFDFAMVLDPEGFLIARTDRDRQVGTDMTGRALVTEALNSLEEVVGIWQEEDELYYAVAMPLNLQFDLLGFLVAGFRIDDVVARDVSLSSGTQVAFLVEGSRGPSVVVSTLGPDRSQDLVEELRRLGGLSRVDQRFEVRLAGRHWAGSLTPLRDNAGAMVGATAALIDRDEQMAPFRRIQTILVAAGGVAIFLGLVLSLAVSRAIIGPLRRLVGVAQAVRQGDYSQPVDVERGDEVGQLALAIDSLQRDLRERQDMESYITQLSRTLPEPAGGSAKAVSDPMTDQVVLVGVELRRFSTPNATADPPQTIERLSRELRRAAAICAARGGRLESLQGHRMLAVFKGEGRASRALAAATEMMAALSARQDAFDETAPPLVAITSGEVVTGSVVWEESPAGALVGFPAQKVEGLMREAAPGEILIGKEIYKQLEEVFQRGGVTLNERRGLVTPLPFFTASAERLAPVVGVDVQTAGSPTVVGPAGAKPTLSSLGPGALFGERFEILSVLGMGGAGVVYKARDRELDDIVALKTLRDKELGATERARLKDELKLARKITHPNVLRTFDFGELDDIPYISMEYVRGVTLRFLFDQTAGRLPYSAGLHIAKQVCTGLEAAHGGGVLHRDIKPENIIIEQSGNAKLMDFGIARPTQRAEAGLTREGWVVGTPQYLAPEQLQGEEVDVRADIYALGIVLFEIFTGRLPFTGSGIGDLINQHLNEPPPPPSSLWQQIPPQLEALIVRCLEKQREQRYASVADLRAELENLSG